MERYINAEEFKRKLIDEKSFFPAIVARTLEEMPEADVEEVKHGKWIEKFEYDMWFYECPFCDHGYCVSKKDKHTPKYCEECGAKMDGGNTE